VIRNRRFPTAEAKKHLQHQKDTLHDVPAAAPHSTLLLTVLKTFFSPLANDIPFSRNKAWGQDKDITLTELNESTVGHSTQCSGLFMFTVWNWHHDDHVCERLLCCAMMMWCGASKRFSWIITIRIIVYQETFLQLLFISSL
jgi:hypothetical protein